jgi:hypothetical protein
MTVGPRMEIGTSTGTTLVRLIAVALITTELVIFVKLLMLL